MKKRNFDNPNQPTLFDVIIREQTRQSSRHPAGSLDIDRRFRAAVSEAIKGCPLSRYEVAAKMSELVGVEITESMLNSWTAESKEQHRFPAIFMPAFFEVTKTTWPYRVLANPVGLYIMESPAALRSEMAALDEQIKKLKTERKKRQAFLNIVDAPPGA